MTQMIINNTLTNVTPELLAEEFAKLDSEQQAKFFNHIDKVASKWNGGKGELCFQLQHITDEDSLTLAGRRVMQEIGEYSHWGLSNGKLLHKEQS